MKITIDRVINGWILHVNSFAGAGQAEVFTDMESLSARVSVAMRSIIEYEQSGTKDK